MQWAPSTGADNYTVSVTPDLPSLGGPVTTTGTSLVLQDVPYNTPHTVSIVATNCAGSSAATETVINIAIGELFFVDVPSIAGKFDGVSCFYLVVRIASLGRVIVHVRIDYSVFKTR